MAKLNMSDVNDAYCRGLASALRLHDEGGAEAIRNEIRFRGVNKFSLPILRSEFLKYGGEAWDKMIGNCKSSCEAMAMLVLFDEFDFTKDDIERFMKRYELKTDCLLTQDLIDWQTYEDIIREEIGIDMEIPVAHDSRIDDFADFKKYATEDEKQKAEEEHHKMWEKSMALWSVIGRIRDKRGSEKIQEAIMSEIGGIKGIGEKKKSEIEKALMRAAEKIREDEKNDRKMC